MNSGNIVKYSASAGSGKTHVLAKEYLYRIFENPLKYRKILAVTFTNKAAAEMKHRILDELFKIAQGENTAIFSDLKGRFPQYPDGKLQEMSKFILSSILSDYSRFSLTTIDSFFQKVFRSFAKEIGIPTNYGLYIEYNTLLRETITDIIREMKENDVLYDWLRNSIYSSYDDGKAVRLEETLYNLSKLVYSEQFKLLTDEEQSKLFDFDNIKRLKSELKKIRDTFEKSLKQKAVNALAILEKNNVTSNDLYKGKTGLFGFLESVSEGTIKSPSNTVKNTLSTGNFYSSRCNKKNVDAALKDGFDVAANSVVELIEKDMLLYVSADIMQKNIDYVAVLGHVVKSLRERMANENNYVLADTGDLLRQIIGKDQTPFIYEKTGNEYDVFMIDEFQDTSIIQYQNFKSLLENSIAQGYDSLIVGDAKQSIYRWRNGDWSILNEKLPSDFSGRVDAHTLNTNWRSLPEIVKFNNSLFKILASIFDEKFPEKPNAFSDVYNDATQNFPVQKSGGYVRMEVVDTEDNASNELSVSQKVAEIIEQCQDAGYKASDICVLVKKKDEGTTIMKFLSEYSSLNNPDGKYNFDMLSSESLMVGSSSSVRFIVAVMLRVLDAQNILNNCEMLSFYLSIKGETHNFDMSSLVEAEQKFYPEGYEEFIQQLESKSLFEMAEEIISFFKLEKGDIAGLNCFQNQILDYMNTKGSDLEGFIEMLQSEGMSESIVLSGEQDAIRIMTIHKSKGLPFKIVIIPFINWSISIHNNTKIWVKADAYPFNMVGKLPAYCYSNMKDSLFANDYELERWSTALDSLNVLYVALTRAEDRLYGFLPMKKSNKTDTIDRYILEAFDNDGVEGEQ
ncbi:MAG: UvrD-helicase domain-containing protein, partial [Bacteroidales bacterium]|nr:UvrD-helicase domain-containing protein [Bacteroidales bacterium]